MGNISNQMTFQTTDANLKQHVAHVLSQVAGGIMIPHLVVVFKKAQPSNLFLQKQSSAKIQIIFVVSSQIAWALLKVPQFQITTFVRKIGKLEILI